MLLIFRLQCKQLLRFTPALLALVLLQCIMGQMAAIALKERNPEMHIGYYVEQPTALTDQFMEGLLGLEEIHLIKADNSSDKSALFNTGKIQAFVLISPTFDGSITEGTHPALTLFSAPGVTDCTLLMGHLTNQWLFLRAEALAASHLGENDVASAARPHALESDTPIVSLLYEGPLLQKQMFITPPAFGIPALFLLLAFLHCASFSVGNDNARWKMKGQAMLGKGTLISVLTTFIFWGCSVLLYTLGMWAIYQIAVPLSVVLALMGLTAYVISVGGLLAYCGRRQLAAWIFVPCLLLNMTIGGGLWNAAGMKMLFPALLPVSAVISSDAGVWSGAAVLWVQAVIIMLLIYGVSCQKAKVSE